MERSEQIQRAVESYRGRIEPWKGDCGNVAAAISEFFDNTQLVSISSTREEHNSAHFAVRVDGVLYDGFGRTSREELVRNFSNEPISDDEDLSAYVYEISSPQDENYIVSVDKKNGIKKRLEELSERRS